MSLSPIAATAIASYLSDVVSIFKVPSARIVSSLFIRRCHFIQVVVQVVVQVAVYHETGDIQPCFAFCVAESRENIEWQAISYGISFAVKNVNYLATNSFFLP